MCISLYSNTQSMGKYCINLIIFFFQVFRKSMPVSINHLSEKQKQLWKIGSSLVYIMFGITMTMTMTVISFQTGKDRHYGECSWTYHVLDTAKLWIIFNPKRLHLDKCYCGDHKWNSHSVKQQIFPHKWNHHGQGTSNDRGLTLLL